MGAALPVHFHRELELPWIISGCSLARIGKQRTNGRDVVAVGDVEHVGYQIHVEALSKIDALGNAQIVEDRPGGDSGVAAQIAVQREQTAVEAGYARLLEDTGGRCFRIDWVVSLGRARGIHRDVGTPSKRRQLQIVSIAGDDVERTSRSQFDQRSEGPVTEDFPGKPTPADFARLIDTAENKAM